METHPQGLFQRQSAYKSRSFWRVFVLCQMSPWCQRMMLGGWNAPWDLLLDCGVGSVPQKEKDVGTFWLCTKKLCQITFVHINNAKIVIYNASKTPVIQHSNLELSPPFFLQKHILCISIRSMDFVPRKLQFFWAQPQKHLPYTVSSTIGIRIWSVYMSPPSSSDGIDPPAFLEKRGNKRHLEKQNLGNTKHSDL